MAILVNYLKIRRQLICDYGYTEYDVLHTVWRLMKARPEVKEAFAKWFDKGIQPSLAVDDVSWCDLTSPEGRNLNPYNAFLFMDTLIANPDLGFDLLIGQSRPSMRIDVSKLAPDLQEYVKEKTAEERANKPEIKPDDKGNIEL